MALIQCQDCGSQISDQADMCIKCGRPMRTSHGVAPVRTIEATGKDAKTTSLLGAILILVGLGLLFSGASPGVGILSFFYRRMHPAYYRKDCRLVEI